MLQAILATRLHCQSQISARVVLYCCAALVLLSITVDDSQFIGSAASTDACYASARAEARAQALADGDSSARAEAKAEAEAAARCGRVAAQGQMPVPSLWLSQVVTGTASCWLVSCLPHQRLMLSQCRNSVASREGCSPPSAKSIWNALCGMQVQDHRSQVS